MKSFKLFLLSILYKIKSIIFPVDKNKSENNTLTDSTSLVNDINVNTPLPIQKKTLSSLELQKESLSPSSSSSTIESISVINKPVIRATTKVVLNEAQIPKIISVSLISLNKLEDNLTELKLSLYFTCKIKITEDSDFILLINNMIIKTTTTMIVSFLEYNLIELTTTIPNYINSAYISILVGSPNEEELTTRSFSNNPLNNIFPYIKCSVVNPLNFRWLLNSKSFISKIDNISYYNNTFIYKLPIPISFDNFERRFDYSIEAKSSTLNLKYSLNINFENFSSVEIKIINNSVPLKYSNLGSIYILFYPTKSNMDYSNGFFPYNKTKVYLENNNCEIHFKLDLPTAFIDNISLIQSYYLPTEYLLTTYENTIFVNSSYKSITTKFESYH